MVPDRVIHSPLSRVDLLEAASASFLFAHATQVHVIALRMQLILFTADYHFFNLSFVVVVAFLVQQLLHYSSNA